MRDPAVPQNLQERIMDASALLSPSQMINILAILVLLCPFLYSMSGQHRQASFHRVFIILLTLIALTALSEIVFEYTIIMRTGTLSGHVAFTFNTLCGHTACFFLCIYLLHLAGYGWMLKKYPAFFGAVLTVDLILIMVTVLPASVYSNLPMPAGSLQSFFDVLAMVPALVYLAASLFFLWKTDKILTLLPAILFVMWCYFNYAMQGGGMEALLLAICVTYIYFSVIRRSLLIQIGGVVLILFVIITVITGSNVTSAAFNSYLKTIHDRNAEHLEDVERYMEHFSALPWLVDYWTNHAPEVKAQVDEWNYRELKDRDIHRLKHITNKQAKRLAPAGQLDFAILAYIAIDKEFIHMYKVHDLDDLFLIRPFDRHSAMTLFDAERTANGGCKLGEDFDIEGERSEWNNYARTVNSRIYWVWGRYTPEDDFGFFRKISLGRKRHSVLLATSFKRSDIYAHMTFISSFRIEAMAYLSVTALITMLILYLMVLRPLSAMSGTIKRYHDDKDSRVAASVMDTIRFKNEIGDFAGEFTSLTEEIDRYTADVALLAGEKEKVNTELRMAASVQAQALPTGFPAFPGHSEFDVYAHMQPAKKIGGDFYDFFFADEKRLFFLIADVSDKGMPAALFMMSAKILINYIAHEGGTPGAVLSAVNDQLCQNNDAIMFVTIWMGMLDIETGTVVCANAGHEPPVTLDANGGASLCPADVRDMPIGIMPGTVYEDYTITLQKGDGIFVFTDGVTDAKDASQEFYGEERLLDALSHASDHDPKGLVERVSDSLSAFVQTAEQFDDVTMLCLKYYGPA